MYIVCIYIYNFDRPDIVLTTSCHITYRNESYHTQQSIMSLTATSHVTHSKAMSHAAKRRISSCIPRHAFLTSRTISGEKRKEKKSYRSDSKAAAVKTRLGSTPVDCVCVGCRGGGGGPQPMEQCAHADI